MYKIEYSASGLGSEWEAVPESGVRCTAEEAREEARVVWSRTGTDRDWVRVIREGAKRPVFVFLGGRFRVNMGRLQRIPSRRCTDYDY